MKQRILITGMSGTGKSSVIEELNRRGYPAVDTDSDEWCEWKTAGSDNSESDWIWRENKIQALLQQEHHAPLFVSGCKSNQGKFYPQFDYVVLLTAPVEVLLNRVATRQNNPYGKSDKERAEIIRYTEDVEPLLRSSCDREINTAQVTIQQVADALVRLARP
jgi:dephospho-CoA kinase